MLSGLANNIQAYLVLSTAFFVFGVLTVLARKNSIGIFMGVELILNAAALNFVAFQVFKKNTGWLNGHIFSLFVIILAAIEAAVALAIVLRVFGSKRSIDADRMTELKG